MPTKKEETVTDRAATRVLAELGTGERQWATKLLPVVYDELRRLAAVHLRDQPSDHTLQPTALVNELYVKLADHKDVELKGRGHFFTLASKVMRQILVDHARARSAKKRSDGRKRVTLCELLL